MYLLLPKYVLLKLQSYYIISSTILVYFLLIVTNGPRKSVVGIMAQVSIVTRLNS